MCACASKKLQAILINCSQCALTDRAGIDFNLFYIDLDKWSCSLNCCGYLFASMVISNHQLIKYKGLKNELGSNRRQLERIKGQC